MINKHELREAVISRIEERFSGSVVVWSRDGYPEQVPGESKVQVFEAYGIPEANYPAFADFIRELKRTLARPAGFSIMVHDLTLEETREYRRQRYQKELSRRASIVNKCQMTIGFKVESRREWRPLHKGLSDPTISGTLTAAA
jgi:hypothetical protein